MIKCSGLTRFFIKAGRREYIFFYLHSYLFILLTLSLSNGRIFYNFIKIYCYLKYRNKIKLIHDASYTYIVYTAQYRTKSENIFG